MQKNMVFFQSIIHEISIKGSNIEGELVCNYFFGKQHLYLFVPSGPLDIWSFPSSKWLMLVTNLAIVVGFNCCIFMNLTALHWCFKWENLCLNRSFLDLLLHVNPLEAFLTHPEFAMDNKVGTSPHSQVHCVDQWYDSIWSKVF